MVSSPKEVVVWEEPMHSLTEEKRQPRIHEELCWARRRERK
jgi:hypothetical protein